MVKKILLEISGEWVVEPIRTKVILNNDIMFAGEIDTNKTLDLECSLEKENILEIHLLNKPKKGTIIDGQGNIIRDTFLRIDNVMIDQRKLRHIIYEAGRIIDRNGDVVATNTNRVSFNLHHYRLDFPTPVGPWLRGFFKKWSYNQDTDKSIQELTREIQALEGSDHDATVGSDTSIRV
jgi:hypothetical protein